MGNAAGMLCGWTDPKLSLNGRKQANVLMPAIFPNRNSFKKIYTSDMLRCESFADISLGFNGVINERLLTTDKRLREINFGDHEGKNYDLLSREEKEEVDSIDYQAPNGESWMDVRMRFVNFMNELETGEIYCAFTHGGTICSFTYDLGLEEIIKVGSAIGLSFDKNNTLNSDILFKWEFDENMV